MGCLQVLKNPKNSYLDGLLNNDGLLDDNCKNPDTLTNKGPV